MDKPVIVAICGKSATGKDSTAKWLVNTLNNMGCPAHLMVSDTTRPARVNEKHGIDYRFIDKDTFIQELKRDRYFEHTEFRGWFYGTHWSEVSSKKINIGVFNLEGLEQLQQYRRIFDIVVVYLKDKWWDRMRRSRDREGRWRFEYLRRSGVDLVRFLSANKVVTSFKYNLILKNENGVVRRSRKTISALREWKLIAAGQNSII